MSEKVCDHYRIIRSFMRGGYRVIKSGLTLEEARTHCQDPETSSSTAKSAKRKRYTERVGPWFDGYDSH